MIDKYSFDKDYTYVLGIALVIDALKYIPNEIQRVYLSSNATLNKEYNKLISLCKDKNVDYVVDDKVINHLSNKENCYGLAIINKYKTNVNDDRHIILKDFNDEGEIGTIIRTMASFDYKNLIFINCDIDIYDPMVIRSSMGGYFYVNKEFFNSLDQYYDKYHREYVSIGLKGDNLLKEDIKINDKGLLFNNSLNNYFVKHKDDSCLSVSSIVGITLDLFKKL